MTASFAILFRVGVHAGYLDRAIAGIVRSAGQRPLQLRRACLTLIVSLRGGMLHDGLALAGMRQTGDQDQCDDVHGVPWLLEFAIFVPRRTSRSNARFVSPWDSSRGGLSPSQNGCALTRIAAGTLITTSKPSTAAIMRSAVVQRFQSR